MKLSHCFYESKKRLLSIGLEVRDATTSITNQHKNVGTLPAFSFPISISFSLTQSAKSWLPLLPLIAHALEL